MIDSQREVARFMRRHALQHDPAMHMLDLMSEVGELAKRVLQATDYGRRPLGSGAFLLGELGDSLYSLLALASVLELDADQALLGALEKYEARIDERGRPGSR